MTDEEVEAVARALVERKIRIYRKFDTPAERLERMIPSAVALNWREEIDNARAAIAALDAARNAGPVGYRKLPPGTRCRCIKMKTTPDGTAWCCAPER